MTKRVPTKSLGGRLRAAREMAGISTRSLDALAGITAGHTSLIETGRRTNIESRTAEGLARALGISLDWLLLGKGETPNKDGVSKSVSKAEAAKERTDAHIGTGG